MNVEHVLAVPTRILHEAGLFQGLNADFERYLPALLDPRQLVFLPRPQAEEDPSYKQIIPYLVLRHGDTVFHYTRGKGGGESRLHALRSVGVGGHINPGDEQLGGDLYRQGMLRELHEEVVIETTFEERVLGLINDDALPVGRVHLGIVHILDLAAPLVRRREVNLHGSGFARLDELRSSREEFETWSRFVLDTI